MTGLTVVGASAYVMAQSARPLPPLLALDGQPFPQPPTPANGVPADVGPADNGLLFVEGFEPQLPHWGEKHGGAFQPDGTINSPHPPYNRNQEYGVAEREETVVRAGVNAIRFTYDSIPLGFPPDLAHNQLKAGSQVCQYTDGSVGTPCTFAFSVCFPDDNWLTEGHDGRALLFMQVHDVSSPPSNPTGGPIFNISLTQDEKIAFTLKWVNAAGNLEQVGKSFTIEEIEALIGSEWYSEWHDIVVSGQLDQTEPYTGYIQVWIDADAYTDTPLWQRLNTGWGLDGTQAQRQDWAKHPYQKYGTYYWWTKQPGATYGTGSVSGRPVTRRTLVLDSVREVREAAATGFAKVKPPGERPDTCQ
jgi:hypothetical protein